MMPCVVRGAFILHEVVEDPVCLHRSMRSIVLGEVDELAYGVSIHIEVLYKYMPETREVTSGSEGHHGRDARLFELVVLTVGFALEVLVGIKEGHALPESRMPSLVEEHIVHAELEVLVEALEVCGHLRRHDIRPHFMRVRRDLDVLRALVAKVLKHCEASRRPRLPRI